MSIRLALLIMLLSIAFIQLGNAQKNSRKKSKEDRNVERYFKLKQKILDTSFIFQTKEIISPFTPNSLSTGYLRIQGNSLRIQELDWVNNFGEKNRFREGTILKKFQMLTDDITKTIVVKFDCSIKGFSYFFTITYGIEIRGKLEIKKGIEETVKYSGRFRW